MFEKKKPLKGHPEKLPHVGGDGVMGDRDVDSTLWRVAEISWRDHSC